MNKIATLALAAVAAALFTVHGALAQSAPAAAPPPPGDAARGKAAFLRYGCYECHGTVGQGNYGTGAKLAPHPPPWAGGKRAQYVRKPASATCHRSPRKFCRRGDLADIYAYLVVDPGREAKYTQIPVLNLLDHEAQVEPAR